MATTWSLSFEYVEQTNPAAAELLRLCAFLAPDDIPEELLTGGAPHWPPALQQAVTDRFRFNQMLETLLAFSLVKRLSENRLLSIHRLVQVVQQERLEPMEQRQWAERVVRAVNGVFPRDPQEVGSWQECQRYLEQVQACDALIQQHQLLLPEAAEVLDRAGTYLRERALYSLAEPLYRQALSIWEQQAKPDPEQSTKPEQSGTTLLWQDKPALAELLHQQALHIREQQVGPEHLDVAESLYDLAGLYRMQGKYSEAEPLYLRALRIREQQLRPEHPLVADSLHGLAVLYKLQGNYAEAEPLYLRALRIREQQLGPEHLLVAESLNDLAGLYSIDSGEICGSRAALLAGAAHLGTAVGGGASAGVLIPWLVWLSSTETRGSISRRSRSTCGHSPSGNNSWTKSIAIWPIHSAAWQESIESKADMRRPSRSFCGPHTSVSSSWDQSIPWLAFTLDGLAHLYSMQDKPTDAERLYQRALSIREHQLGQEHSDVAVSLTGLANLYTRQGKYAKLSHSTCERCTSSSSSWVLSILRRQMFCMISQAFSIYGVGPRKQRPCISERS